MNLFHRIIEVFGLPPESMISRSKLKSCYYNHSGEIILDDGYILQPYVNCLEQILEKRDDKLIDFLNCCFKWEPCERISAELALCHPWIKGRD